MDKLHLKHALADIPLGWFEYHELVGSTNDIAIGLLEKGAPDMSIVIADEQSSGRGRLGRMWITQPGVGLAFSLILRDLDQFIKDDYSTPLITSLGALSVCEAIYDQYSIRAKIKWPNDVLIVGRKVAGILVEGIWEGDQLVAVILGIGVNVKKEPIPSNIKPSFPITSIEECIAAVGNQFLKGEYQFSRIELLHSILQAIVSWRERIFLPDFITNWESRLAYLGEHVVVRNFNDATDPIIGTLLGLGNDGHLQIRDSQGIIHSVYSGDLSLRQDTK